MKRTPPKDEFGVPDESPRQDRAKRRLDLDCSYCAPHKGENIGRKPKHGEKKKRGKK